MKNDLKPACGRRVVCRVLSVGSALGKPGPACSYGHRPGEEYEIGETCPPGLCSWAFNALYPFATALRFGGNLPWEDQPGRALVSCPDPANTVVFELRVE